MSFTQLGAALAAGLVLTSACLDWDKLQNGACGDGFLGREEACDDGNRISGDGCNDECHVEPAICGDGRVDPNEDCDDANSFDNDACVEGCVDATCGDGKLWDLEEACDDGNRDDGDGCAHDCTIEPLPTGPRCGNATLDDGEVCDDGNTSNEDACLNGCAWSACGDGQKRRGVEECDDGNPGMGNGCSRGCLICGGTTGSFFRGGNAHCYSPHTQLASQTQARATCQMEGGDLWTVTSEAEGSEVTSKLGLSGRYWLGLQTNATSNQWVSGEVMQYTSFAAGEPSAPTDRCVAFETGSPVGVWSSESCSTKLPYVCERGPALIFPDNHHAFRLHTGQLNVAEAQLACHVEGGYLAILESDAERLFVGKAIGLAAWLDGGDTDAEGSFVWASGQTVDSSVFAAGQPDDTDHSQNCLFLNGNDRYVDDPCTTPHAFICELE